MRGGTLKEDVEHTLGFGRLRRLLRGKRTTAGLGKFLLGQHAGERERTEAGAGLGEPLAAGQEQLFHTRRVVSLIVEIVLVIQGRMGCLSSIRRMEVFLYALT